MTEVVVVCEGQTEEVFVKEILAPALAPRYVFVQPRLIATSRHSRGGSLNGQRVLRFLQNTLRERSDTYVTTFFDLYALPSDFPGWSEAAVQADPVERATAVEAGFHAAVVQKVGCRPKRFLPHIQPYEFESLLFFETERFVKAEPKWKVFTGRLEAVRRSARSPEHINDGADTHPSARLQYLLRPRYNKVRHGVAVAARIGIDRIRAECSHFGSWLARVEVLPSLRRAE